MRATILFCLVLGLAVALGCNRQNTAETAAPPPEAPRMGSGLSLYPLSNPQPVAPLQNWSSGPTNLVRVQTYDEQPGVAQPYDVQTAAGQTYVDPAYGGTAQVYYAPEPAMTTTASGALWRVEATSPYMSTIVPLADPPVIVNEPGRPYTVTTVQPATAYAETVSYTTNTPGALAPYATPASIPTVPVPFPPPATTTTTYSYTATAPVQAGYAVPEPFPVTTTTTTVSYIPPQTVTYAPQTTVVAPVPVPYSPAPVSYSPAPMPSVGGGEYRLVPAPDIPPGNHPNDAGPSQWFEIIRPDNGPIRIGRVSSTCVCVGVRVPNRHVAAGERALIEARTLTRPPYNNLTYGMYVSVMDPVNVMLDTDVTISL